MKTNIYILHAARVELVMRFLNYIHAIRKLYYSFHVQSAKWAPFVFSAVLYSYVTPWILVFGFPIYFTASTCENMYHGS